MALTEELSFAVAGGNKLNGNLNGVFKKVKDPMGKEKGIWKKGKKVFVFNNGVWELKYLRTQVIKLTAKPETILSALIPLVTDTTSPVIFEVSVATGKVSTGDLSSLTGGVILRVTPTGEITGNTTSGTALILSSDLLLINNGHIRGAGGNGGHGGASLIKGVLSHPNLLWSIPVSSTFRRVHLANGWQIVGIQIRGATQISITGSCGASVRFSATTVQVNNKTSFQKAFDICYSGEFAGGHNVVSGIKAGKFFLQVSNKINKISGVAGGAGGRGQYYGVAKTNGIAGRANAGGYRSGNGGNGGTWGTVGANGAKGGTAQGNINNAGRTNGAIAGKAITGKTHLLVGSSTGAVNGAIA